MGAGHGYGRMGLSVGHSIFKIEGLEDMFLKDPNIEYGLVDNYFFISTILFIYFEWILTIKLL